MAENTKKKKEPSFEENMARIEEIVRLLERGDTPLEASLALFEEGAVLVKQCGGTLDRAEQKVTKLTKGADGTPQESVFGDEGGASGT